MKTVFKPMKPIKPIRLTLLDRPLSRPIEGRLPAKPIDMGGLRKDIPFETPVERKSISFETPVITEKNDGPVCSVEQISHYQENWDKILPPKIVGQLKRTGDIMHGSFSVNMQLPTEFHREAHDIDVWAKKPSLRAKQMENAIDKCVGCDIAHIKEETMGKTAPKVQTLGPPCMKEKEAKPKGHFKRYTVITQPKNDVDVDYSTFPTDRPIIIRDLKGVRHETLDSALERAYELQYRPMRAGRAREDIQRIEAYMATQQGKKKWKETTLR